MLRFLAGCMVYVMLVLSVVISGASANHDGVNTDPVTVNSRALVFGNTSLFHGALEYFRQRGKLDVAASMIVALRFRRDAEDEISAALQALTQHNATSWFEWMEWQQNHPEVKPHKSYLSLKLDVLSQVDPRYRVFFRTGWNRPADMRIRLEEIVWGGPRAMTGIPALDHPPMISAADAEYMLDDDLVFGIEINGDVRAYPLRIMGWHEMFNDVIGGVPVALAYCTLCGSGILFETKRGDHSQPFVFGSSGMLYRSNKLMFDWETYSLWNQFTGEPVAGPLAKSGIRLKTRPVVIMSWQDWRAAHPGSRILSLETGFRRDYASGAVYRDYFASPDLMFPVSVRDSESFRKKDYVFGIRDVGVAKAWPLSAFAKHQVINDRIGQRNIVLIGDARTRTVRAFERNQVEFEALSLSDLISRTGESWKITEANLVGPKGRKLPRVAGVLSYWFAWDGYMGLRSEYYDAK